MNRRDLWQSWGICVFESPKQLLALWSRAVRLGRQLTGCSLNRPEDVKLRSLGSMRSPNRVSWLAFPPDSAAADAPVGLGQRVWRGCRHPLGDLLCY